MQACRMMPQILHHAWRCMHGMIDLSRGVWELASWHGANKAKAVGWRDPLSWIYDDLSNRGGIQKVGSTGKPKSSKVFLLGLGKGEAR